MTAFEPEPGPIVSVRARSERLEDVFPPLVVLLLAVSLLVVDQVVAFLLWSPRHPLPALLASAATILLPVVALHLALGIPWRRGLGLERPPARELGRLAWMLVAAVPLTYTLSALSSRWLPPDPAQLDLYRALVPSDWKSIVGGVTTVAIVVPLAEEVLFRRLVLGTARRWMPGTVAAIVTGGLFALAHGAAWMFLPIAFLGALLGWVVVRTGSLTLSWIGHGLFNLVAYVELCLTHDPEAQRLERWSTSPAVWLPCLALLGGWVLAERRMVAERHAQTSTASPTDDTGPTDRDAPVETRPASEADHVVDPADGPKT